MMSKLPAGSPKIDPNEMVATHIIQTVVADCFQSQRRRSSMTNYVQARITNPSHYFETPGHVLSDVELGHEDKVKILKSMAVDADQKLEATSEGMAGSNSS